MDILKSIVGSFCSTREAIDNDGKVLAVHLSNSHSFSKLTVDLITLVAGLGVKEDSHFGKTVQHLSRIAKDPTLPNLRQVHLIHSEVFVEVDEKGFSVQPGDLGENITTTGVDLLGLPTGTRLHLGESVIIELTGLRNPCAQIEKFQSGLLAALLSKDADGRLVRKAGVMSVVITGGDVRPGDAIRVELPEGERRRLEPV
jgi:hypothetical protein